MGNISFPDTIIFDPTQADFANQQTSGETFSGGRLMNYCPHTDGLIMMAPDILGKNSANLVLTRNGKGDWSLNRTAAGAETYYVRGTLASGTILRTGETYNYGEFPTSTPAAGPKGIEVVDFFAILNIGVVALTSATLRLGKTVYGKGTTGAAPTQTDIVAATALTPLTTITANDYAEFDVAGPSPLVFSTDDLGLVEVELNFVMANTGTVQVAALGCHVNFNYD